MLSNLKLHIYYADSDEEIFDSDVSQTERYCIRLRDLGTNFEFSETHVNDSIKSDLSSARLKKNFEFLRETKLFVKDILHLSTTKNSKESNKQYKLLKEIDNILSSEQSSDDSQSSTSIMTKQIESQNAASTLQADSVFNQFQQNENNLQLAKQTFLFPSWFTKKKKKKKKKKNVTKLEFAEHASIEQTKFSSLPNIHNVFEIKLQRCFFNEMIFINRPHPGVCSPVIGGSMCLYCHQEINQYSQLILEYQRKIIPQQLAPFTIIYFY